MSSAHVQTPPLNNDSKDVHAALPPRRQIELELLHQYMTETYKTIAQGTHQANATKLLVDIPLLALQHTELMDTIFSLTAFHMASTRPQCASLWNELALQYKDRALGLHSKSIARVIQRQGKQNIEALFGASIVIAITTIIGMKQESASFLSILYAVGRLSFGSSLLESQRPEAISSAEQAMLSHEVLEASIIGTDVIDAFQHLRTLALREDDPDGLRSTSVDSLWKCFEYCARGWRVTGGSGFGALCQYSMLVDRAPQDSFTHCVAIVIGVLMHSIRDRWWVADLGKLGIAEVSEFDSLQDSMEGVTLMTWAQQRAGL